MAGRPRLPEAVAKTTGADAKNPGRFSDRKPPKSKPLGNPPAYLGEAATSAWLEHADRTTLELASRLTAVMRTDFSTMTGAQIGHLRACLTEMGATPAARSKIKAPDDQDASDPLARYN